MTKHGKVSRFLLLMCFISFLTITAVFAQNSSSVFGTVSSATHIDSFFQNFPTAVSIRYKGDSVWKALKVSRNETFTFPRWVLREPGARLGFSKPGFDTMSIPCNVGVSDTLPTINLNSSWSGLVAKVYVSDDTVQVEHIEINLPFIEDRAWYQTIPNHKYGDDDSFMVGFNNYEFEYSSPKLTFLEGDDIQEFLLSNKAKLGNLETVGFRIARGGVVRVLDGRRGYENYALQHDMRELFNGRYPLTRWEFRCPLKTIEYPSPIFFVQILSL